MTLRLAAGLPSLRREKAARIVRRAVAAAHRPAWFRIVHFTVMSNHVHLVCEASGAIGVARGIQGFAVRVARRLNRAWGRGGAVFADRYHVRALKTPREVRNAIAYVLQNARRHAAAAAEGAVFPSKYWVDPYSSAIWFDGWKTPPRSREAWMRELEREARPTAAPLTWLLSTGWRRWGLIAIDETPK